MLLKSNISTPKQIIQIHKESKRQKCKIEKNKVATEWNNLPKVKDSDEDSSSSSISMYSLDFGEEVSYFLSNRTPTIVIHNAPLPMHV